MTPENNVTVTRCPREDIEAQMAEMAAKAVGPDRRQRKLRLVEPKKEVRDVVAE